MTPAFEEKCECLPGIRKAVENLAAPQTPVQSEDLPGKHTNAIVAIVSRACQMDCGMVRDKSHATHSG
jgi:hypothetical protein